MIKNVKDCKGLDVGDKVSDFTGIDQNGNEIKLSELVKKGKVVIVFYRGQWCPMCMPHIRKLQNSFKRIKAKGASLILITPEKQENIQKTIFKNSVTIPILYDEDYIIMNNFDVNFIPSAGLRLIYNVVLRADLKQAHSDSSETLPIPATYIIGTDSKIIWRHFNRDYKKRSKMKDILNQL